MGRGRQEVDVALPLNVVAALVTPCLVVVCLRLVVHKDCTRLWPWRLLLLLGRLGGRRARRAPRASSGAAVAFAPARRRGELRTSSAPPEEAFGRDAAGAPARSFAGCAFLRVPDAGSRGDQFCPFASVVRGFLPPVCLLACRVLPSSLSMVLTTPSSLLPPSLQSQCFCPSGAVATHHAVQRKHPHAKHPKPSVFRFSTLPGFPSPWTPPPRVAFVAPLGRR